MSEGAARVRPRRPRAADIDRPTAAQMRQRCVVELGTRLRDCETARQISGAVSAVLGEALRCSRTGYAVIKGQNTVIENDWTLGAVKSLSGVHKFHALGQRYVNHIQGGEMLVVPDVRTHPVLADGVDCWRSIDVRALLNVPLHENGELVGMLYAHDAQPRDWTAEDVALVREVADRTWEAMGRARAVEALRAMNETLEAQVRERTLQRDRMWALSTDIMMVTNRDGVIVSVNPAWTRLLGWREDELVGAPFFDFMHPDDLARTELERLNLLDGRLVDKFENRYLAKDGRAVWLSWKAVPDGDLIHSAARDITAEREQAEALQAAEEALRHAQKMEAVGQLTGGIAHDFNNLLQGIVGCLELAARNLELGRLEALGKYHAQAKQSAERASALTHRLLAFSRRQPLDPKPVRANDLLLMIEPLLRRTLGETIALELELAPDLWPTLCDPNQLDSAILNLAINARDAMPDGGVLTIRTANAPDAPGRPKDLPEGDAICLAVTDTGVGMPPDVAARAFEPFYTTKPLGQGTGLGLSMVYGFMRQSGGEAKIASAPGAGTTIRLYLRRYAGGEAAEPDGVPAAPPAHPNGPRRTVLVLEDEAVVRGVVVDVLNTLGFDSIEAADGPQGLEILQSGRPIDLLVTDIGLPGLNGRQVADAGRLLRPGLRVLFMTGYAESAAMSDDRLAPGMQMITKPFPIDGLAERILQLMPPGSGQ
jgi:PAS domain S-box-containing protein